jgi:hypothetical protein
MSSFGLTAFRARRAPGAPSAGSGTAGALAAPARRAHHPRAVATSSSSSAYLLLSRVTVGPARRQAAVGDRRGARRRCPTRRARSTRATTPTRSRPASCWSSSPRSSQPGGVAGPSLYEVLLLGTPDPQLGVPAGVPVQLRARLQRPGRRCGRRCSRPAAVVHVHPRSATTRTARRSRASWSGPRCRSRGSVPYELYYLFPLTQEQDTLDLVQRLLLVAGTGPRAAAGGISWLVTRQVVTPVRLAARTAERFSAGASRSGWRVEAARTTSPGSRPRSTRWRLAAASRSASSRTCPGCSAGSSRTSRTSCARR